jgi:mercuric ion transport protein
MTIKDDPRRVPMPRGEHVFAAGGLRGALAASSCYILPLALFSLGVSGAWIGYLTRLAPYQPYILAATLACLAYGYWRVYRTASCAEGEACATRLPGRFVKAGLIVATLFAVAALGLDFVAPLFAFDDAKPDVKAFITATTNAGYPSAPQG